MCIRDRSYTAHLRSQYRKIEIIGTISKQYMCVYCVYKCVILSLDAYLIFIMLREYSAKFTRNLLRIKQTFRKLKCTITFYHKLTVFRCNDKS